MIKGVYMTCSGPLTVLHPDQVPNPIPASFTSRKKKKHLPQVYYQGDTRPTGAAVLWFIMAQNQVILQFRFATFGDSMLQKMNLLRHQRRFCDVTVRINQLEVPGHKVVFAAGSSFLRDQFILQQDSKEVQISMMQEAEVGQQLLLSCYTGQLEFPELELVHYLTVASFLQMGHIVEQCTQALSKFIKPQSSRQLEVDVDIRREKSNESLASQAQRDHEHSQVQTIPEGDEEEDDEEEVVLGQVEGDNNGDSDDDEDDDDDDVIIQPESPVQILRRHPRPSMVKGDITIVKVESVSDVAENSITGHFSASPPAALHSPEPQHSLINSTVDSRGSEMAVPPGVGGYPLSPPPQSPPAEKYSGHQRSYDKPLQWYHQCPKCARVFRQLENYANHLKMHKLFMCLLCGKTFTQKGNLHRHMRVHAGIKPFQCKICGKTFTQKCSLLDHLNLHSGDKPHRCNYCDMVFAHKPVLRKHLKQIHGKNSFDNANEGSLHEGALEFDLGQMLKP
ncbi:zinc finger and BTB domain-containing protein 26 [Kryptolebias marmoratus]|nr:zinc finger and BTB domain-containing protein 26 [Kryptolebias marmoratus]